MRLLSFMKELDFRFCANRSAKVGSHSPPSDSTWALILMFLSESSRD